LLLANWILGIVTVGIAGCGKTETNSPQTRVVETGSDDAAADAQGDIEQNLAQLPPGDATLAAAQQVCPVSGEPLGSMGKPIKVELQGEAVFICCEGCEETLKANPDEYLAKLKSK
jgi:hypothetical protein